MKSLIAFILISVSSQAFALDCVSADGVTIADGTIAVLHLSSQPRKQIGPAYTCGEVARIRACNSGVLSDNPVTCSEKDSGGCVDSWIQMMGDHEFAFARCQD